MVRSIFALPRPAPTELLHVLLALTEEPSPFFVEELLKSLLSSGDLSYADGALERRPSREWRIPRTVRGRRPCGARQRFRQRPVRS